jgi:hypothetical protein
LLLSTPQCPTRYIADGSDVPDNVVRQNVQLPVVIVSDILDSNHLPITLSILDHVRGRAVLDPGEKCTDWKRFQSLTSELLKKPPWL